MKSSLIICDCQSRRRAREFIAFLRRVDRIVKIHLNVHVGLDNSSTHKTDEVKGSFAKHQRFNLHFTPTSASWMNLVDLFVAEITRKLTPAAFRQHLSRARGALNAFAQRKCGQVLRRCGVALRGWWRRL